MEDTKFYQHGGYDLFGILRAALKNFSAGHVRQGASTITQQLARNSFALKERTFRRKLLEIFLARRIEDSFGKQKIMELYLNRIYFGGGLYGAEAAVARLLCQTGARNDAGGMRDPRRPDQEPESSFAVERSSAASREARNYALTRMRDLGFIDRQTRAEAQAEELAISNRQNAQGQTYAVDYIRQQVIAAVGWDRAMNEGFRIHTTIDADLQKVGGGFAKAQSRQGRSSMPGYNHQTYATTRRLSAQSEIAHTMASRRRPNICRAQSSRSITRPAESWSLVGGRDFEHNQYDRALAGASGRPARR